MENSPPAPSSFWPKRYELAVAAKRLVVLLEHGDLIRLSIGRHEHDLVLQQVSEGEADEAPVG
jgi:hypothetical protein